MHVVEISGLAIALFRRLLSGFCVTRSEKHYLREASHSARRDRFYMTNFSRHTASQVICRIMRQGLAKLAANDARLSRWHAGDVCDRVRLPMARDLR
jgi:hypothetical protein